ncbi:MAG TPA: tetratricopeptide repeat protein [Noviherbaspirillum sp.]|uniref:O-linked N-acetylglucosamine transferase family protein n=1 Tax=Noviherbaspirillum sp. TaxID=1926288 RepID=UPI002B471DE2|nr:tetratricopeptide repeat protein [Noviherbaspirillum sp.]HJV88519.1 tetratricopeptide repeat protein [Noviherbaspirillum sp.]
MNVSKIGRNDPCPCGSKKKYKQCCLQKELTSTATGPVAGLSVPAAVQSIVSHLQAGRLSEAESICTQVLQVDARNGDALHYLGLIAHERGDCSAAVELIESAIAASPEDPFAYCNLGNALLALGRLEEALCRYARAIELKPDFVAAQYNCGSALLDLKRHAQALESFDRALRITPDFPEALGNRGNALRELGRHAEALDSYDRAIKLKPADEIVLNNRGLSLHGLRRFEGAAACFRKALQIRSTYAPAHNNLGNALCELRQFDAAVESYRTALAIQPDYTEALYNLGIVMQHLKRIDDAVACYHAALEIAPNSVNAWNNLGAALQCLRRYDEAAACYQRILDIDPAHRYAFGMRANCALNACDWDALDHYAPQLRERLYTGSDVLMPFHFLGLSNSPADQLACAKKYLRDCLPDLPLPLWNGERYSHERIKVAYLSADFHEHATSYLMAELFELHDSTRFETIGISFGPDDQSPIRARIAAAFDRFFDVRTTSDAEVARLLRELEVDIAVDLKGYTQDARFGILAHRPAPIQVSYLGYPGTMGAGFIDYIIADKTVLPLDQQPYFTEKIVHLPDCYQVNDTKRAAAQIKLTRGEFGLPDEGFVFCCFNNNYKITPDVFAIWMRLLRDVEGSVLWLLHDNDLAASNLRKEARAHGVDPARVVFAQRAKPDAHLARHRLADLFVDTLPVNAHTTASDALWMGLPVVTCLGSAFAGRVASSLVAAAGLGELVAENLEQYETIALTLASNPVQLQELRTKLDRHVHECALFDTNRSRQHLETAYRAMWEEWQEAI